MVEHKKVLKTILDKINKWFVVNSLSLNFNKTKYMHFSSIPNIKSSINVNYWDIQINSTCNIKFLGLIIDSSLSWKDHINHLVMKLSAASYSIRILSVVMTQESLKMIYFAYVHSVVSYGIIFWCNSTYSNIIFKIQKRIIRIMMKARNRESCRPLFRQLHILPSCSQYIFSLLLFVVKNLDLFSFNSDVHSINTRQVSHLHLPANKLIKVQKGANYSGIRIFNNLPQSIRDLSSDVITFKQALKISSSWFILFPK
jgi:hypothetical protein